MPRTDHGLHLIGARNFFDRLKLRRVIVEHELSELQANIIVAVCTCMLDKYPYIFPTGSTSLFKLEMLSDERKFFFIFQS